MLESGEEGCCALDKVHPTAQITEAIGPCANRLLTYEIGHCKIYNQTFKYYVQINPLFLKVHQSSGRNKKLVRKTSALKHCFRIAFIRRAAQDLVYKHATKPALKSRFSAKPAKDATKLFRTTFKALTGCLLQAFSE